MRVVQGVEEGQRMHNVIKRQPEHEERLNNSQFRKRETESGIELMSQCEQIK